MSDDTIICFTNAKLDLQEDGWAMLAPYGTFPGVAATLHPDKTVARCQAVQVVSPETAGELVNQFNSLGSRFKRFLRGVPIYVGHPDALGIGDRFPHKEPVGTITDLQARDTGLWCRPVFTNAGCEHLNTTSGMGFSPRWHARKDGIVDGVPSYIPTELKSAGLTDQPNLPVELLNESESMTDAVPDQATGIAPGTEAELSNRWVTLADGRRVPIGEPALRGARLRSYRRKLSSRRKSAKKESAKAMKEASKNPLEGYAKAVSKR